MNVFKIEIFVPAEVSDRIRAAIAEAGAGRIGDYDHCSSTVKVTGYWRPLVGANPYIGQEGKISSETEIKIEVNCNRELIPAVLKAIRDNHPYEEPVINIIPLVNEQYFGDESNIKYGP